MCVCVEREKDGGGDLYFARNFSIHFTSSTVNHFKLYVMMSPRDLHKKFGTQNFGGSCRQFVGVFLDCWPSSVQHTLFLSVHINTKHNGTKYK